MSALLLAVLWAAGAWPALSQTSPIYAWTNFVGQPGGGGSVDGTGSAARFLYPNSVAVDTNGNVFVADTENYTIRKVSAAGVVTTLAGSPGASGTNDGTGGAARFNLPTGVAVDSAGNVLVADWLNHTIRQVTPAGVVTTLAGSPGVSGTNDGTGSAARFNQPGGVAVDSAGNVFVADTSNHTIRKVTSAGVVTTLAGSAGNAGSANGTGDAARFNTPWSVTVDTDGNVFVADTSNHTIRKVTSAGVVATLAGRAGNAGSANGTGSAARFNQPDGVAVDTSGNVFVADYGNHTIRQVTSAGVVTTLAGQAGASGTADGTNSAARFYQPGGVAVDRADNVFVADTSNHTIRQVTSAAVVTTLAGSVGVWGTNDGTGTAARFNNPRGVAVGSAEDVFVADSYNNTIRKVTPGGVVTTLAGSGSPGLGGSADGTGGAARFYGPSSVAVDNAGNVFVADTFNCTIRKVTPAGVVTRLAGSAGSSGTNDGTGGAARFNYPYGVAVDTNGNVFVADSKSHTIRQVTPAGVVTTLAGSAGSWGTNDGPGGAARFYYPEGVAVDRVGNVFVADTLNNTIRQVTPAGVVTTLAGSAGNRGSADGPGSTARFLFPASVAVDRAGYVFVADHFNHTIRKVTPAGVVTTIGNAAGVMGGADGLGRSANFAYPCGIAVDGAGTLYVADSWINMNASFNNRISKGTPIYPCIAPAFDGTHLQLSWPAVYLGWELQAQTNLLGAGLGTNWLPVDGSTTDTQMSIPIDPANPAVFYRLHQQSPP